MDRYESLRTCDYARSVLDKRVVQKVLAAAYLQLRSSAAGVGHQQTNEVYERKDYRLEQEKVSPEAQQ
jgi:hypothetical protein